MQDSIIDICVEQGLQAGAGPSGGCVLRRCRSWVAVLATY
ncbi:Unknown protein sequence [Pseudomonas syringae pv. maculicola]|nr:Unknown protein sequence [Pseudomonas syringae pv. maculicola]